MQQLLGALAIAGVSKFSAEAQHHLQPQQGEID
jgi:hypothetical protein